MRKLALAVVAALVLPGLAGAEDLKDEDQKTLYALGLAVGRSLEVFKLNDKEFDLVKRGLADQVGGKKAQVDLEAYQPKIQALAQKRMAAASEALQAKDKQFMDQVAKEKGAQKLPSGLIIVPQKEGTGASPKETDTVKVHYRGTLVDGKEFDSSHKRGQPAEFPLNGVIKCWTEGLQKMKVGGKAKLICPASIAYGDQGRPPVIPAKATLAFEIELLDITKNASAQAPATPPPAAPATPAPAAPAKK
jgi:FKBP-type peptidyl-prolyl cis-trans isomerase FkpA